MRLLLLLFAVLCLFVIPGHCNFLLKCADQHCTEIFGTGMKPSRKGNYPLNVYGILNDKQFLVTDITTSINAIYQNLMVLKYQQRVSDDKVIVIDQENDIYNILSRFDKYYAKKINETVQSPLIKLDLITPVCSIGDVFLTCYGDKNKNSIINSTNPVDIGKVRNFETLQDNVTKVSTSKNVNNSTNLVNNATSTVSNNTRNVTVPSNIEVPIIASSEGKSNETTTNNATKPLANTSDANETSKICNKSETMQIQGTDTSNLVINKTITSNIGDNQLESKTINEAEGSNLIGEMMVTNRTKNESEINQTEFIDNTLNNVLEVNQTEIKDNIFVNEIVDNNSDDNKSEPKITNETEDKTVDNNKPEAVEINENERMILADKMITTNLNEKVGNLDEIQDNVMDDLFVDNLTITSVKENIGNANNDVKSVNDEIRLNTSSDNTTDNIQVTSQSDENERDIEESDNVIDILETKSNLPFENIVENEQLENKTVPVERAPKLADGVVISQVLESDFDPLTMSEQLDLKNSEEIETFISQTPDTNINIYAEGFCQKPADETTTLEKMYGLIESNLNESSMNLILVLVITSVTILVYLILSFRISEKSTDRQFVAKLNEIEQKYLQTNQEKNRLEDELNDKTDKYILREQYDQVFNRLLDLEKENQVSKNESEEITQVSLEALKKASSEIREKNCEIVDLKKKIADLKTVFESKSKSNDEMKVKLQQMAENVKHFEETNSVLQLNLTNSEQSYNNFKNETINEISLLKDQLNSLKLSHEQLQNDYEKESTELSFLKEKFHNENQSSVDTDLALSNNALEARLQVLLNQKVDLSEKLTQYEVKLQNDNEKLRDLTKELDVLRESLRTVTTDKDELTNKLGVLSVYFEERKTDLLKQIEYQKAVIDERDNVSNKSVSFMETLKEENVGLSKQVKCLKEEMEKMSLTHKKECLNLEQQYNEAYMSSHKAERALKASKAEERKLRNLLTQMAQKVNESNITGLLEGMTLPQSPNGEHHPFSYNTGDSALPPPPQPPPFMPGMPPMLPPAFFQQEMFTNDQRRPPTLGRLSSPPPPPFPPFMPRNMQDSQRRRYSDYNSDHSRSRSHSPTCDDYSHSSDSGSSFDEVDFEPKRR